MSGRQREPLATATRRHSTAVDVDPEAVRQARLEAGLSLAQVAGREMTRQAVHLIENGKVRPRRRTLQIIARRLGVSIESLLAKPPQPGVTAVVAGEQITIRRGRVDILGIDLESGTVGTWPDGEIWVRLARLPRALQPHDPPPHAERRAGTAHEEIAVQGDGVLCPTCGRLDQADPTDPTVRHFHGDSFDDEPDEDLVLCQFCGHLRPARSAHLYRGFWIGDECCWDERLRASE